jgi:hypothetical protein
MQYNKAYKTSRTEKFHPYQSCDYFSCPFSSGGVFLHRLQDLAHSVSFPLHEGPPLKDPCLWRCEGSLQRMALKRSVPCDCCRLVVSRYPHPWVVQVVGVRLVQKCEESCIEPLMHLHNILLFSRHCTSHTCLYLMHLHNILLFSRHCTSHTC